MNELTPVVTQSQFNPLIFWPLLVIVGLVIGLIYWHRKNPTAEAKALKEAAAGAKDTINHLTDLLHDVHEAIASKDPTEVLTQMSGGKLPEGFTVFNMPPMPPSTPAINGGYAGVPQTPEDKAAILAARTYRVAAKLYGVQDSRTLPYVDALSRFAHWSDVLVWVGGPGYSAAEEATIAHGLK